MSRFRVMTFNIRGSEHADGVNNWANRSELNVEVIRRAAPHIISFQEYQPGNQLTYDRHLLSYEYEIGPAFARESETQPYHCAIYWHRERFERLDSGTFYLSTTPDVYSLDWGIGHGRGVHWLILRDNRDAIEFVFANTHLPHDSEEGRIRGARLITKKLSEISQNRLPVIIAADFNSRPTIYQESWRNLLSEDEIKLLDESWHWFGYRNNANEIFKAAGFTDTFIAGGNKDEPCVTTVHSYMQSAALLALNFRIDWILTQANGKEIRCESCEIITHAHPPLFPSDHYPVIADIEML